jgi:DNA-binding XRE family transcriptional regulator
LEATKTVRQLRREKEISQEQLAKEIGVSRQTIIAIEKGHVKRPSDE